MSNTKSSVILSRIYLIYIAKNGFIVLSNSFQGNLAWRVYIKHYPPG